MRTFNAGTIYLRCLVIAVGLWVASVSADETRIDTIFTSDGVPDRGELSGLKQNSLIFATAEGPREIATEHVVKWGHFRDYRRGELVLLADGSQLVCRDPLDISIGVRYDNRRFTLRSQPWQSLDLADSAVRAILFRPQGTLAEQDRWLDQLQQAATEQETVWLASGDILRGSLVEINEEFLELQVEGRSIELSLANVLALAMRRAMTPELPRPSDSARLLWGFATGSQLWVSRWNNEDGKFRVVTADQVELIASSQESVVAALTTWQSFRQGITYLSDLEPAAFRHIPLLDVELPLRKDRNVTGTLLRKDGRVYAKGLGMATTARAAYAVADGTRWLQAELAVDQLAEQEGSVIFRVYVSPDGKRWQRAYESAPLTGRDSPVPMSVSVAGMRYISLIADFADRGDVLDYADWLDIHLLK
jgi:hypothetical protein